MTTYMDASLKREWLEALRSGKYKQGKLCLRDQDNAFCCLGVLCDLVDPDKWFREEDKDTGPIYWNYGDKLDNDPLSYALPPLEARLFWNDKGDSQNTFPVASPEGIFDIDELNDKEYTFDQLADIIEAQVVGT